MGVYETYDGPVVEVIDARGDNCLDGRHRYHQPLAPAAEEAAETEQPSR